MERGRPDGQARRRAATRQRIIRAGTRLFESRGYAQTSIRDISEEAGIAPRTIYLHFDSKAAILLAYFDDWIDDFVDAVCAGPAGEDIDVAVVRAYGILDADGKVDNRTFAQMTVPHPVIDLFAGTDLDIPGHVLQHWVRAQDVLTDHFRRSLGLPVESIVPRARAAAIFATWMVTLLCYRDVREGTETLAGPMHEVVFETVRGFGRGLNADPSSAPARSHALADDARRRDGVGPVHH